MFNKIKKNIKQFITFYKEVATRLQKGFDALKHFVLSKLKQFIVLLKKTVKSKSKETYDFLKIMQKHVRKFIESTIDFVWTKLKEFGVFVDNYTKFCWERGVQEQPVWGQKFWLNTVGKRTLIAWPRLVRAFCFIFLIAQICLNFLSLFMIFCWFGVGVESGLPLLTYDLDITIMHLFVCVLLTLTKLVICLLFLAIWCLTNFRCLTMVFKMFILVKIIYFLLDFIKRLIAFGFVSFDEKWSWLTLAIPVLLLYLAFYCVWKQVKYFNYVAKNSNKFLEIWLFRDHFYVNIPRRVQFAALFHKDGFTGGSRLIKNAVKLNPDWNWSIRQSKMYGIRSTKLSYGFIQIFGVCLFFFLPVVLGLWLSIVATSWAYMNVYPLASLFL